MERLEELTEVEFIEAVYETALEHKNTSVRSERLEILSSIKRAEKDISFNKRMVAYYEKYLQNIIQKKTTILIDSLDFTKDEDALWEKRDILETAFSEELTPYLTCFSKFERQLIIWLYRNRIFATAQLKDIYPSLYYYLGLEDSDAEPEEYTDQIDSYFKNYRRLRLAQETDETYNESLYKWNHNESVFFEWYLDGKIEYPEIYLKKGKFKGNTYVLDAVGAEFLFFIIKLLETNGCVIESKAYGKCHLPSITSVAKKYYQMENDWILDYDNKVIHGETYYHTHNIEKSLTVIEEIINDILSAEGEQEFAIIADHGSSVGHKIDKKDKKYNFVKAEHDGRCYHNSEKKVIEHTDDYVIYDDESGEEWVIALNQQSLYNNSKYAVHGGATLEEVLVPIIIAHKGKKAVKTYRVRAVDLRVSGLKREVEFKINPVPSDEKVVLKAKDGTITELVYREETKTWIGKVKRGIEQDIEISVGAKTYKFRTVPPTKMGDDLFDD